MIVIYSVHFPNQMKVKPSYHHRQDVDNYGVLYIGH
jgi:hypothetical protein